MSRIGKRAVPIPEKVEVSIDGREVKVKGPGSGRESAITSLEAAGLNCNVGENEASVLWQKLSVLAPIALTTTALEAPLSAVMVDPTWRRRAEACVREVASVAAAEGFDSDPDATITRYEQIGDLRSSMQKDRAAGKPLELDAIGGAVLRAARRHGVDAPATQELVDLIEGAYPSR